MCKTAERLRESVCEGAWIVANRGSVSCKNGCWRNRPFGIDRFVLTARSYLNDKDSPSGL
jgi:hypothetical protein